MLGVVGAQREPHVEGEGQGSHPTTPPPKRETPYGDLEAPAGRGSVKEEWRLGQKEEFLHKPKGEQVTRHILAGRQVVPCDPGRSGRMGVTKS